MYAIYVRVSYRTVHKSKVHTYAQGVLMYVMLNRAIMLVVSGGEMVTSLCHRLSTNCLQWPYLQSHPI